MLYSSRTEVQSRKSDVFVSRFRAVHGIVVLSEVSIKFIETALTDTDRFIEKFRLHRHEVMGTIVAEHTTTIPSKTNTT